MSKDGTYREAYGMWGGNPKGTAPKLDKCCESVCGSGRGDMPHQCNRARGHGPNQAYCKQHDPDAVKARRDASMAEYISNINKERYKWNGPAFYEALKAIAEGHNDASGYAQEIIDTFHKGER